MTLKKVLIFFYHQAVSTWLPVSVKSMKEKRNENKILPRKLKPTGVPVRGQNGLSMLDSFKSPRLWWCVDTGRVLCLLSRVCGLNRQ